MAADGEVVAKEPYRLRGAIIDRIVPLDILQQLPVNEGDYRLRVSLHDVRSGERTVWEQPITRLPPEPALVDDGGPRHGTHKRTDALRAPGGCACPITRGTNMFAGVRLMIDQKTSPAVRG